MTNRSKTALLHGIWGTYNYGCEAIVRGTATLLRQVDPDIVVWYASARIADDRIRLRDSGVNVIPRRLYGRYSARNVVRKLLTKTRMDWEPVMEGMKMTDGMDAVLSIGGDIYTAGPGQYPRHPMRFGDAVLARGIPYILFGASVGPFEVTEAVEDRIRRHLRRISLITAREPETISYLARLGVSDNVVACADPAYVVAPDVHGVTAPTARKLVIGINLSPLSARHVGRTLDTALTQQARAISALIEELDADVLFLPHVYAPFASDDDDVRYLQELRTRLPVSLQARVELVEGDPGFVGMKHHLTRCHLVIAARMHCAINAVSCLVPTIFASYSSKAVGMCRYVYGNLEWNASVRELLPERLVPLVASMQQAGPNVRNYLRQRVPAIRRDAAAVVPSLSRLLAKPEASKHRVRA
ncbi:Polysaccharide pyruvyl transferase family protein WcaK [Candidatus Defluviicoccus seviourii]|uniref:Polysaccharide pyruvyl transferase family protein WcaK n=1 Tax=Candidatus Defluviicoccus seviourii TaxID=2565273 RepID=A0A564WCY6_9PROT|nr:Polysaccharide pyruvyl transferase family protein WcaK [Candidatus Defluviicoccus seviourii]